MPAPSKILLVDDETRVRSVLRRLLSDAGYSVIESTDGFEALDQIAIEQPALVILDVEMPRLNGWGTLEELRRRGARVPVLMLTNVNDVPDRLKGFETGADDYLGKPCDLKELLARVKALLRRTPDTARFSRLKFDDLIVDLSKKVSRRNGQLVKLTRTEYALLDLLAQHHGQPVPRDEILKQVWGASDSANSHAFDSHLWRLRKKIGDGGAQPRWLRNSSGVGYVLECEFAPEADDLPSTA